MKTFIRKSIASPVMFMAFMASCLCAAADDYIVIAKDAKVFDEPKATGYVTLNRDNQEVCLAPGMAFKSLEKKPGWNVIEYYPGLRGYVSDQVKAAKTVMPKAGVYPVANKKTDKLKVEGGGNAWSATANGKSFTGKAFGNVVVFFDDKNNPAYTLTDTGNGTVAMTYDNGVTRFF